ncbi:MAG: hypothetical protein R8K50_01750, partial [Mariprofundus sp.]
EIPTSWLSLEISEGRNRQVRRMTAAVGFPTLRLIRYAIGPITLDGLQPGGYAEVNEEQLWRLFPQQTGVEANKSRPGAKRTQRHNAQIRRQNSNK